MLERSNGHLKPYYKLSFCMYCINEKNLFLYNALYYILSAGSKSVTTIGFRPSIGPVDHRLHKRSLEETNAFFIPPQYFLHTGVW